VVPVRVSIMPPDRNKQRVDQAVGRIWAMAPLQASGEAAEMAQHQQAQYGPQDL